MISLVISTSLVLSEAREMARRNPKFLDQRFLAYARNDKAQNTTKSKNFLPPYISPLLHPDTT